MIGSRDEGDVPGDSGVAVGFLARIFVEYMKNCPWTIYSKYFSSFELL